MIGIGFIGTGGVAERHAQALAELRAMAAHLLPQGPILTEDITPVIGAHIGPGVVGFAAVAAKL